MGVAMRSDECPTARPRKTGSSHAINEYRIAYNPPTDFTAEAELKVLAAVYRFVLDHYQERDGVATNDAEGTDERAE